MEIPNPIGIKKKKQTKIPTLKLVNLTPNDVSKDGTSLLKFKATINKVIAENKEVIE